MADKAIFNLFNPLSTFSNIPTVANLNRWLPQEPL